MPKFSAAVSRRGSGWSARAHTHTRCRDRRFDALGAL